MKLDQAYLELKIIQDLLPVGASNRPGNRIAPAFVTVHNTDNDSKGANAAAHAKYMKGADAKKRKVSWHFTVDDKFVYQSVPTNEKAWHAGTNEGNTKSIGIEICMNPELDVVETYDRAALLVAVIARRSGVPIPGGIVQHNHWSGKDYPTVLRHKKNGWTDFLKLAIEKSASLEDVDAPDLGTFKVGKDDHQGFAAVLPAAKE